MNKFILITSLFLTLVGCNESSTNSKQTSTQKDNILSKMEYDGVYIHIPSSDRLVSLEKVAEKKARTCDIAAYSYCNSNIYGFPRKSFAKTKLTKDEMNSGVIYVRSSDDFNLRIGNSSVAIAMKKQSREKILENNETWLEYYCHSVGYQYLTCKGGNSGFEDPYTTFKVKKIEEDLFKIKANNEFVSGKYFFWLETSKVKGFREGYPFLVM